MKQHPYEPHLWNSLDALPGETDIVTPGAGFRKASRPAQLCRLTSSPHFMSIIAHVRRTIVRNAPLSGFTCTIEPPAVNYYCI